MKNATLRSNLLTTFLDVIKIDEIFGQEKEIVTYVTNFLKSLDISYKIDSFGNVIAYIDGDGDPLLLNTHLDIPENVPSLDYTVDEAFIRGTGKSILGADPKSGLAVLLEFTRYIKEQNIQTNPIELVFTLGEEAGLQGARNLDYSLLTSKIGLVLDEDGPCTQVVTKAPGRYCLDAALQGKTAHVRDWNEGINVLPAIGNILTSLKQGEIVKGVTFNIGIVSAGTARNSVPGNAAFKAELRSFDMEKLTSAGKKVEDVIKHVALQYDVRATIESGLESRSYALTVQHPLFKKLESTYKSLGLQPNYYETYGGSDAAEFNAHGITCVPIGSAYYLAHQYHEYVSKDDMEDLVHFLVAFTKSA